MARKLSPILTDAERDIMNVLWSLEQASAREVHHRLQGNRTVAFTTIQTMLKVLESKGHAKARREGRALVYRPILSRKAARSKALDHLVDGLFGGSRKALALHLAKSLGAGDTKLEDLLREIDAAEESDKDGGD